MSANIVSEMKAVLGIDTSAYDHGMQQAERRHESLAKSAGKTRDAMGRFVKSGADAGAAMDKSSKSADGLGGALGKAGKMASGFGGIMQTAIGTFTGNLMMQAAGAVKDFVKDGVKGFSDLQQGVANIKSIKPEIDTKQVFNALNEMQTRVPQTAKELADSLYDVHSSIEVSSKDGLALVEKFARGAVGAQTDAKTFGTATMGVLNAYGLSVKNADHISDLFFNTVKSGVVTGQQLASGLGPVTASAKAAGQSLETYFGAIAAGTKAGGDAAQNINNINNLFQKITTDKAKEGLKGLGIAVADGSGKFRQMDAIVGDFIKRTQGMSAVAKADVINKIFPDAQARQGFQTLIGQYKSFTAAIDENKTKAGSARAAYETMSNTFQSQSKIIENSFGAIKTQIGAELLPAITPLITAFAKQLPGALAETKKVMGPIAAAFKTFVGETAGRVQTEWPKIKTAAIEAFKPIMPLVQEVIAWFRQNLPLMQQTVKTVLGAIAEFWKAHGAQIMAVVRPLVAAVLGAVRLIMQVVNGDFKGAANTAFDIVKNLLSAVFAALKGLHSIVTDIITRLAFAVKNLAIGVGTALWEGIVNGIKSGWAAVKSAASNLGKQAYEGVTGFLQIHSPSRLMHEAGQHTAQGLANGMKDGEAAVEAAGKSLGKAAHKGAKSELEKQQIAFKKEIAELTKQIGVLEKGGSRDGGKAAADYRLLGEAQRQEITRLRERKTAVTEAVAANEKLHQSLKEMQGTLRDLNAGANKSGQEAFAAKNPHADPRLVKEVFNTGQTIKSKEAGIATETERHQKLAEAIADVDAKQLKRLVTQQMATARTEQERLALDVLNVSYTSLSPALKSMVDTLAQKSKADRDAEASTKAHAKAMHDEEAQGKKQTTLWKQLGAETRRVHEAYLAATDQITKADAKHVTYTEQLADRYKDLGVWGMVVVGVLGQEKAATDALNKTKKDTTDATKKQAEADKEAAEKSATLTTRLKEGLADARVQLDTVLGQYSRIDAIKARMNISSRSATPDQEALVKQIAQTEKLAEVAGNIKSVFKDAFSASLENGANFFKSLQTGFKRMLVEMATEWAASQVIKAIFGLFGKQTDGLSKDAGKARNDMIIGATALTASSISLTGAASAIAAAALQMQAASLSAGAASMAGTAGAAGGLGGVSSAIGMAGATKGAGGLLGAGAMRTLGYVGLGLTVDQMLFKGAISKTISKGLGAVAKGVGGAVKKVGKIFGFANGGRPPLDRPSVVGEDGPELFWPDKGGTVTSHGDSKSILGDFGGGSSGPVFHGPVTFNDAADVRRVRSIGRAQTQQKLRLL